VRTYVHGTIYSLLSRKCFQDLAQECGLPDMLAAGAMPLAHVISDGSKHAPCQLQRVCSHTVSACWQRGL
jgi:hypothetical protein